MIISGIFFIILGRYKTAEDNEKGDGLKSAPLLRLYFMNLFREKIKALNTLYHQRPHFKKDDFFQKVLVAP